MFRNKNNIFSLDQGINPPPPQKKKTRAFLQHCATRIDECSFPSFINGSYLDQPKKY